MFFKKRKNTKESIFKNQLNDSQNRAAHFENKHLLVLAGAGTGKTKTIIARAKYLIENGVNPSQILILTFTRKASSEIVERVYSEIPSEEKIIGSTFHGWCNMILFKYSKYFNVRDYTVIDRDDQESIFKLIVAEIDEKFKELKLKVRKCVDIYSYGRNTKNNLTESISNVLYDLPNKDLSKDLKINVEKSRLILAEIIKKYQNKKQERKYVDYDDLLIVIGKKLASDKVFLNTIGNTYAHILVDEMQDTNPIQWDILDSLKLVSKLFCVGDDAQSIYSFRGADFKNIHSFNDRVVSSTTMKLEDNYRSTQEILDLSNWLLSKSELNYNKKLSSKRGSGHKPFIISYEQPYELANWIADDIENNHRNNNELYFESLALARSSRASFFLQAVLLEKNIPFMVFGGRGFMEAAHIKDLISLLRVSVNVSDEIAWIRFLTLWPGIGNVGASKIINSIFKNPSKEKAIDELSVVKTKQSLSDLFIMANNFKLKPFEAIENLVGRFNDMFSEKYGDYDKRKGDFDVLKEIAKRFSSVQDLITSLTIDNSESNSLSIRDITKDKSKNKDAVRISTIHSAKGLEAKNVYLLDAEPGNYPSVRNLGNKDKVEEDRRLLYVALTRAKDNLFICKGNFDSATINTSDYFLNEMPNYLFENINVGTSRSSQSNINGNSNVSDLDLDMDLT